LELYYAESPKEKKLYQKVTETAEYSDLISVGGICIAIVVLPF
jgi:hypothetical protein